MSKRKIKKYTDEFKKSSVKLALESNQPIADTAKNLGMSPSTLHGWVKNCTPNAENNKYFIVNPFV